MAQKQARAMIILFLILTAQILDAQALKVTEGGLILRNGGKEVLVKRLAPGQCFRGYDLVDSEHVFVAYQCLEYGDATTRLGVVDIGTGKEATICDDIGGTGFSYFEYNPGNDLVMFNREDGMYVVRIHDSSHQIVANRIRRPEKVMSFLVQAPHAWFWKDSTRFGINWVDSSSVELHEIRSIRDH